MKILITGSTGFLGTHLIDKLLKKNHEIVCMSRNPSKLQYLAEQGCELRYGDLLYPVSLHGITKDVDVVIHLAALMRFHATWDVLYQHNVKGTQFLVEDASNQDVDHFVYISSTEAIGPVQHPPANENASYQPTYDYGKTKQIAETWLNQQFKEHGFPVTILRPTGVYGPGDRYVGLSTVRAVAKGKLRFLPGKGNHLVHFTYVDDVVQGFLCTLDHASSAIGETFHIASDDFHTYKEIFTIIAQHLNVPAPTISVPLWFARMYLRYIEWMNKRRGVDDFVMHQSLVDDMNTDRAYSNTKAKEVLGFKPQFTYEQGMKKTIEWYKMNQLL